MSTTWCFVGLLAGRELSFAIRKATDKTLLSAFKMSAKDLSAVILGFIISLIVGYGANSYFREGVAMTFSSAPAATPAATLAAPVGDKL